MNRDTDVDSGDSSDQDLHENDDVGTDADDIVDDSADEALIARGNKELEAEDSNPDEEEQSPEDQDNPEEEEEVSSPTPKNVSKFKDPKTGNWDWQKINAKIGDPELQKTFVESQKAITRFSQEKSAVEKQFTEYKQQTQAPLQNMRLFENLYDTNPKVQAAINEALGRNTQQQQPSQEQDFSHLIQGLDPNDPVTKFVPVMQQQQQEIRRLLNHNQEVARQQQQQQMQATFRQGLIEAQQTFTKLVGRQATSAELELVAQKMNQTRHLNGADWVPSLFIGEIQKGTKKETTQDHRDLKKAKRSLPTNGKAVGAQAKTSKTLSKEEEFYADWDEHFNK